ncbi:MAG: enoyl-CoA hydratase-related protein [Bacteroidia bacterium]|nr:enoyl-CoA hydratase-related protein [Bacteroidia bacterium]
MYQTLLVSVEEKICIITLNRPDKLNALNQTLLNELKTAFMQALSDSEVKSVIITGAGEKAFAAGADIQEFVGLDAQQASHLSRNGQMIFNMIENSPKPVVAAVNGFALGGGCELAMACHLRIASENAKFGQPEVKLGLIPGYGGTQRLVQYIGKTKALELILTTDMISANDAYRLGLVNYVVPAHELLNKCKEVLAKIHAQSPNAVYLAIKSVNAYFDKSKNGFEEEVKNFGQCFTHNDFKEGVSAFLEKRKPNF